MSKNLLKKIVVITVLFSLASISAKSVFAATDYRNLNTSIIVFEYKNGNIHDKTNNETFTFEGAVQEAVANFPQLVFVTSNEKYKIFVGDGISKVTPSSTGKLRYFESIGGQGITVADGITISNPAEAPKLITVGQIVGKVFFDDRDILKKGGWNIATPWAGPDTESQVQLFDNFGNEIIRRSIKPPFEAGNPPEEGYYNSFTLDQMPGGGLYTGKYQLKFYWANNNVDCTKGTESGSWDPRTQLAELCSLRVSGTTTFLIKDDETVEVLNTDERVNTKTIDGKKIADLTREDGVNIVLRATINSPIAEALASAIKWLSEFIAKTTNYLAGWINTALDEAKNIEDMELAWHAVRNIVVTLLLLGLLIIAFANVLSIDIERYGAQRMIPRFVINIVLAYFSFLIVKFLMEVAGMLQAEFKGLLNTLVDNPAAKDRLAIGFYLDVSKLSATDIVAEIGSILFLIIMLIGVVIALFYLFIVLLARVVMIKFLLVMAPVALILGIMPFTEDQLKRWWSELFKWIFMGPAVMGMLLIAAIILQNANAAITIDMNKANTDGLVEFRQVFYLATAAMAYAFAATIPLSMGGQIMAAWDKKVRGGMKWTGGKAWDATKYGEKRFIGASEAWKQMREDRKRKFEKMSQQKGSKLRTKVGSGGRLRRWAAGYKTADEVEYAKKQIYMAQVNDEVDRLKNLSQEEQQKLVQNGDEVQKHAALKVLAANPVGLTGAPTNPDDTPEEAAKRPANWKAQQEAISRFSGIDTALSGDLFKEHSANLARGNTALKEKAITAIKGKNMRDLKPAMVKSLLAAAQEGNQKAIDTLRSYKEMHIRQIESPAILEEFRKAGEAKENLLSNEARRALGGRAQGVGQPPAGPPGPIGGNQSRPGEGPSE